MVYSKTGGVRSTLDPVADCDIKNGVKLKITWKDDVKQKETIARALQTKSTMRFRQPAKTKYPKTVSSMQYRSV